MLSSPVPSGFGGGEAGAHERLREERNASPAGGGDLLGCGSARWAVDELTGCRTGAGGLEPERPRYDWGNIPPRLAPARRDDDLLELPADADDGDDCECEPAPSRWWGQPAWAAGEEHGRLSVSINTGCGGEPERRPLHHSGGGLAAGAPQIAIGLPATEPHGRIQLEISGSASVTVSVTRQPAARAVRVTRAAPPDTAADEPVDDDQKVLARALRLLRESGWYHGALSWQQAQLCLRGTPEGTFLARDSLHRRFVFALSVQTAQGPTSVRVQLVRGRFRLDAPAKLHGDMPTFGDVSALVEHYASRGPVAVDGWPLLTMRLGRPLLKQVPSLQHCCRLALNRGAGGGGGGRGRTGTLLPAALEHYLDQYPYSR